MRRDHLHCLWTSELTVGTDILPGAPAGARALSGAQVDSHASGVPPRAAPPTFEQAGLQTSNSQLQALLPVPRKQRCVLPFTRLEGCSCQRLWLSEQLLGAGSRWQRGTPDSEQTFQGRRGRQSLCAAWPATIPSHANTEQMYPPLLLCHPLQAVRGDFHTRVNLDRRHWYRSICTLFPSQTKCPLFDLITKHIELIIKQNPSSAFPMRCMSTFQEVSATLSPLHPPETIAL